MLNLQRWQIKEKDYNLFQKKKKKRDLKGLITMEDFWTPVIQEDYPTVRQLAIDANNFELKPA